MKLLSKSLICLSAAAMLYSCNGKPEWKVDGRIEGADGQTMYVEASDNGVWYTLDSITLDAGGQFKFTEAASGYPDIYRLRLGDKTLYFPIDSIETVTVVTKAAAFDSDYQLSGTDAAEQLMTVDRKVIESVNAHGLEGLPKDSVLKRDLANVLLGNPSGALAYYIINKKIGGVPLFDPNNRSDLRIIGAVANAFSTKRPADPRTQYLKNLFITNKRSGMTAADTIVAQETSIIEVSLYDRTGKKQSLQEVAKKNPVVLLSFTNYSADYSPALNIELNKVYTNHHNQGLEIYQVGVDNQEYNWRETARNLPWITVFNSETDGMRFLNSYNVRSLPAIFVIKNGEIVERLTDATRISQSVAKYM